MKGLSFLPWIRQCMNRAFGTIAYEDILPEEVLRCLHAKMFFHPSDLTVSVPLLVDQVWHEMILDTRMYKEFCDAAFNGKFLHHDPTTVNDSAEEKNNRIGSLYIVRRGMFPDDPVPEGIWQHEEPTEPVPKRARAPRKYIDLHFKDLNGKVITLSRLSVTATTIAKLKQLLKAERGVTSDAQRLIYAGTQLEDGLTLKAAGLKQESTIHVIDRLRGC
jgi:hypothetical protein